MCVSRGAPKKPSYGPCDESHQPTTFNYYYPKNYYGTDYMTTNGDSSTVDWSSLSITSTANSIP